MLTDIGYLAGAEALYREQLQRRRARLAPDDPGLASAIGYLTGTLLAEQKDAAAETLLSEYLIGVRKRSSNAASGESSGIGVALHHLAEVLRERKGLAEARPLAEEAAALYRSHPDWPANEREHAFYVLEDVLTDIGDLRGIETLYEEQLQSARGRLAPDDLELAGVIAQLAGTLLQEKKFTQAETFARECLTIRERKLPDHWRTFNARSMLGAALLGQKNYAEAEPLLLSGYRGLERQQSDIPDDAKVRLKEALQRLVQLYEATNRRDQADLLKNQSKGM